MIGEGDVLAAFKVVPLSQVVPLYRWSDTSCGHPEPCAVSASTAALVMLPQYLRLSDVSLLHPDVGGAAAGLLADVAASCYLFFFFFFCGCCCCVHSVVLRWVL